MPTRLVLTVERSAAGRISGTVRPGGGAALRFSGTLALLACLERLVPPGSADDSGDGPPAANTTG